MLKITAVPAFQSNSAIYLTQRFIRNHGPAFLAEALEQHGLSGEWVFAVSSQVISKGHSDRLQVRALRADGVFMTVKPADNNSAVRGTLKVTRDKGDPETVYKKLSKINIDNNNDSKEKQSGSEGPDLLAQVGLPELTYHDKWRIVDAVSKTKPDTDVAVSERFEAFIHAASNRLNLMEPEPKDPEYWWDSMERLTHEKPPLLLYVDSHYAVSTAGARLLAAGEPDKDADPELICVSEFANEPGDVLAGSCNKLQLLLRRANDIRESRAKQESLIVKIRELQAALKYERTLELQLTGDLKEEDLLLLLPD